jgi:hypothetical protein
MLPSKIDWLLGTNVGAKDYVIEDSRSYVIRTEAIGRFTTYKYATKGRSNPQRP